MGKLRSRSKSLYLLMIVVAVVYMLYVTYVNFIHDPQATEFLSHKTGLKRPVVLPVWLNVMYVHIVFACVAMIAGAINFSTKILSNHRRLHRVNGYLYLLSVAVVVLTSGYMAPFSTGGKINSIAFNVMNLIFMGLTIAAIVQIKRKKVESHRKWMVRSYAFCFTNMFIHMITFVLHNGFGVEYALSYTLGVYGALVLNFALAEIVIRCIYTKPAAIVPQGSRKGKVTI
ncbi:DUF2306 domain-containing protein [Paenibacillus sp. MZ04-78.2]|uniref:DUF2306 domain-containing protein n=1 Tax=Paenibacillus sp. MZ04-78.2 TaxID=2962034 RepID=UPI0020B785DF|nr:DUF2306 domain-containing protein [Paenibacillus sp. MZ04-78.2]MCP3774397.1 DUF2306 domain-containing protein [Paenibacillus sp. MZ04-78.2]